MTFSSVLLLFLFVLLACHAVAFRQTVDVISTVKKDIENPPDAREDGVESIFVSHEDVFGDAADKSTFSSRVYPEDQLSKVILTSDLFSTGATAPVLKRVLKSMLGHREGLKALWIHDARAGWSVADVAIATFMDTMPEVRAFAECGIAKNKGLWINRWGENGPADWPLDDAPLTLTEDIAWSLVPGQGYKPTTVDAVKAALDEASVLYVPGGNPFTLMKNIRSDKGRELWEHALGRIRAGNLVYLSRSAGSIVAGKSTMVSADPAPENFDFEGLDLFPIPIAIRPHYHAFYIMRHTPHDRAYREQNPLSAYSQDDFLENLNEKMPSVHGIRVKDGEFVVLNAGKVTLMAGGWTSEETINDFTELVAQTGELQSEGQSFKCCCKAEGAGDEETVTCQLSNTQKADGFKFVLAFSGCGRLGHGWHSFNKMPDYHSKNKDAGRCLVPASLSPQTAGGAAQPVQAHAAEE